MTKSRKIVGCLSITLIAAVVGTPLFLIWRAKANLSAKLAQLRAAGEPTSIAELKPALIPIHENAAEYLARMKQDLEAFQTKFAKEFENTELGKSWLKDQSQGKLPTPEQKGAIEAILNDYPNVLPLFDAAAECEAYATLFEFPQGSISFDFMPEFYNARNLAQFVSVRMSLLNAEAKRDEAVRLGIKLLHVSRHIENEPLLIGYLYSLAMKEIAVQSINDVLQRGSISEEVSHKLEAELALHDLVAQLKKAIQAERVFAVAMIDGSEVGFVDFLMWPKLNWQSGMVDYYTESMKLTTVQWFDSQSAWADVREAARRGGAFVELMGATLDPVVKAANRMTAELRCLRILNALNAYARKHGHEASELSDLSLPQSATIDPFTGQPLMLKRTENGWIIYSLMDNGTDDGGDFKDYRDYGIGPPGHAFDPAEWEEEEE